MMYVRKGKGRLAVSGVNVSICMSTVALGLVTVIVLYISACCIQNDMACV